MTKVSGAVLENFAPNMQVLGLPYVFKDRYHAYDIFDGPIGKRLLLESEKSRLRGLAFFDAGQRSFYSKEPIRNCLLYTSPSPRDQRGSRMPSSA